MADGPLDVAFLGLGTMGWPMAYNVLQRGHRLTVWNRSPSPAQKLELAGARAAATPRECAASAEVVITMLADPAAVDAVADGDDGLLASVGPRTIVIDMSTVDPGTARRLDERVRARGGRYLDAPVSGTRKPAEAGSLVIMVGGPDDARERARPVLEAMGRVVPVGAVGQGMAMKLVLNGLGAHMMTGFAAMLVLGVKEGLDMRAMLDVIGAGAFSSPLYATKGPRMLARDFRPDFTLALMLKDQELVLADARALGVRLDSLAAIRDVLRLAVEAGFGGDDLSGVVQWFEQQAGVTLK
jgi:3-hydroxyisobutyrate dehydrogenase-like beta-hydroxyacid dehydrogenase